MKGGLKNNGKPKKSNEKPQDFPRFTSKKYSAMNSQNTETKRKRIKYVQK